MRETGSSNARDNLGKRRGDNLENNRCSSLSAETEQRGTTREYTDVDIRFSTYLPPFRSGTGYIGRMLEKILATAGVIENPVQAAFYLLTRIAYLQPFQDGNKRTSRAMCNVPLIQAKLPPISFIDFGKLDYIVSMLAFYELGDTRLAERCFVDAYGKSISRLARPGKP